jgi:hypothetical protein
VQLTSSDELRELTERAEGAFRLDGAVRISASSLIDLDGLQQLVHADCLLVVGNASLQSLRGLSRLSRVAREFVVTGNPRLATRRPATWPRTLAWRRST